MERLRADQEARERRARGVGRHHDGKIARRARAVAAGARARRCVPNAHLGWRVVPFGSGRDQRVPCRLHQRLAASGAVSLSRRRPRVARGPARVGRGARGGLCASSQHVWLLSLEEPQRERIKRRIHDCARAYSQLATSGSPGAVASVSRACRFAWAAARARPLLTAHRR